MSELLFQGQFGTAWWTQEWLAPLAKWEQWDPERLQRAVLYARRGLVRRLEATPGRLSAAVQDARPLPYELTVDVPTWTSGQVRVLAHLLASEALFVGELLHQRLPEAMRRLLQQTPGAPALAPADLSLVKSQCTCSDRGLLCSHRLAAWLALAQQIEADPWTLLGLRGATRPELLNLVQAITAASPPQGQPDAAQLAVDASLPSFPSLPPPRVPCVNRPTMSEPGITAGSRPSRDTDAAQPRVGGRPVSVRGDRWTQLSMAEAIPSAVRLRRTAPLNSPVTAWAGDDAWAQPLLDWAQAMDQWSAQPDVAPSHSGAFWLGLAARSSVPTSC